MAIEDLFDIVTPANKQIFLVSDLHLDHASIINYCHRPFVDVEEMNQILVSNWNNTIGDNIVYFLGDLSFGRGLKPTTEWLKQLSGDIRFIRGNHDDYVENSRKYATLEYEKYNFLLIHSPNKLPIPWDDWVIHGHKHNHDLGNYPFINGKKKTINVSVEVLDYKPISLDYLLSLNIDSIKRLEKINGIPERK